MCNTFGKGFIGNILELIYFSIRLIFITKYSTAFFILYFIGAFTLGYYANEIRYYWLIAIIYLILGGYIGYKLIERAYVYGIYN